MTPAELHHLLAIDAHLTKLLDIAEKRTPGEWKVNDYQREIGNSGDYETECCIEQHCGKHIANGWNLEESDQANFAFIASCSNNAEASWRSTKATISWLIYFHDINDDFFLRGLLDDTLKNWPLELLKL